MSSASSSSAGSPEPELKRKRPVEKDDASDASDAESDAPALSHAEKRRQKKLEKKQKEGKLPAAKKRKLDDGTATEARDANGKTLRQNSVWVGNMLFKTTQEDLRTFFNECGEITRINMPMKPGVSGGVSRLENRGFAYVDFGSPEAKAIAISLSENPLHGRKLLIKDGDDFTGRPVVAADSPTTEGAKVIGVNTSSKTAQRILRAQKNPPAPTLFFGNLGFEVTEPSLREFLNAHRPKPMKGKKAATDIEEHDVVVGPKADDDWIRKVRLGTFEDSGLCKGFGFVDFASIDYATSALINMKNHFLDGRNLTVQFASADAVRRGPNKPVIPAGTSSTRKPRIPAADPKAKYNNRRGKPQSSFTQDKETNDDVPAAEADEKEKTEQPRGQKPPAKSFGRPRPGAALALAKRQSAAIVPAAGSSKKIVF